MSERASGFFLSCFGALLRGGVDGLVVLCLVGYVILFALWMRGGVFDDIVGCFAGMGNSYVRGEENFCTVSWSLQ